VLVNLGLAVKAWTSGVLRATLHRAIVQADADGGFRARRSMPYFVQPRDQVRSNQLEQRGRASERDRQRADPQRARTGRAEPDPGGRYRRRERERRDERRVLPREDRGVVQGDAGARAGGARGDG